MASSFNCAISPLKMYGNPWRKMYLFSVFKHRACESSYFQPYKLYISEISNQYSIYWVYKSPYFQSLKIGYSVGIIHHMKSQSSLCSCLLIELMLPTHYNEFLKSGFRFLFFFFVMATHLTAILLPESLHDKNVDSIVGFWFNVPLQWKSLKSFAGLQDHLCGLWTEIQKMPPWSHSIFSRWVPLQASLSLREDVKAKMVMPDCLVRVYGLVM